MKIVLVGYMGVGKTTVGRKLASVMGLKFLDTDNMFVEKYGIKISDFFEVHGEYEFRLREREILIDALHNDDVVIATGGGVPCFKDNMDIINDSAISVYIKMNPKVLHERVSYKVGKRPLLNAMVGEDLYLYICEQLKNRELFYSKAMITVKGESLKPIALKEVIDDYLKR